MNEQLKELYSQVLPALESKKDEFNFYGYADITEEALWDYFVSKKWRKKDISAMRAYEMIADVFALTAAQFMTHTQTEAQRNSKDYPELSEEERALLFWPKKSN
ncbi:post-transcriptional regulator [Sporosarcina sp. PTS2304]|uniref:post-transcriptional regulator n=1 Tax=Sporosarcina sp. PTS2304 TaxID=2283194 RepID=UPI0013B3804D|nr:post-transcriptional regulator [Sporosarcina sp. PTS2304]